MKTFEEAQEAFLNHFEVLCAGGREVPEKIKGASKEAGKFLSTLKRDLKAWKAGTATALQRRRLSQALSEPSTQKRS